MDEFRVPKRRVPVEIVLAGGAIHQAAVFLAEHSSARAGAEQVSDLLNQVGQFIPALDPDTQRTLFFGREMVAFVRVALDLETGDLPEHAVATEHQVEVTLRDGELWGRIMYFLPPDKSRLIDYLNEPNRFFHLYERDRLALVNKRLVIRVEAMGT